MFKRIQVSRARTDWKPRKIVKLWWNKPKERNKGGKNTWAQSQKKKMVGVPEELGIVEEVQSLVRHPRMVWVLVVVTCRLIPATVLLFSFFSSNVLVWLLILSFLPWINRIGLTCRSTVMFGLFDLRPSPAQPPLSTFFFFFFFPRVGLKMC